MKLYRVNIRHFRGIKDEDIFLKDISAFVGENNAGKSSVLRSLNSFFHPEQEIPFFIKGSNLYSPQSKPKITLTFKADQGEIIPDLLKDYFDSDQSLIVQVYYKKGQPKLTYKIFKNKKWEDFQDNLFRELKSKVDFLLIPPVRDYSSIVGTEKGILVKIVSEYLKKHTAKTDRVSPITKEAVKKLESSVFKKISKEIRNLYFLDRSLEFSIEFPEQLDYRHILHDFKLKILDQGLTFPPEDCGSGIQSLTLIALYRYLAHLKNQQYILAIEEPESNLHPQAQREVIDILRKGVTSSFGTGVQVILTTHSTIIIDELDHEELVLCRRKADESRGFNIELSQVCEDFWATNNLSDVKAQSFFKVANSEVFFCRHVIVCEGPTDVDVVKCLAKQEKVDLNKHGVSIINCGGVGSLHYPVALLKELSIPYTIIVDKDFFFPYLNNNKLAESRNGNGFPVYQYSAFGKKYIKVIQKLIPKKEQEQARKLLKSNHSRAMELLEKHGVICFKWNLESDLLNSKNASTKFFAELAIQPKDQTTLHIFTSYSDDIKKSDLLIKIISQLDRSNLPNSYKRIRRTLASIEKGILDQQRKISIVSNVTTSDESMPGADLL